MQSERAPSSPVRIESPIQWDNLLLNLPAPHLLQGFQWGEFKSRYGWTADRLAWMDGTGKAVAAAQVLRRRWPSRRGLPGLSLLYCPRGPALEWEDLRLAADVLSGLRDLARRASAISIKIEPDCAAAAGIDNLFRTGGWFPSAQPVQFNSTMILDLTQGEDGLLAAMKPKTRYNIRLAERRGVVVRPGSAADLDVLYDIYAETSVRDGFVIRHRDYYRHAWGDFLATEASHAFVAEVEGVPVGGLIVYRFGRRAWYLYGMSRDLHRDRMPNHALQWAAIEWARRSGCTAYDLWGAPDTPDPSDPMWGVYRFKDGFGARHVRLTGSWEYTSRPGLHRLYSTALPRLLGWARRRQQDRTRRLLDPAG